VFDPQPVRSRARGNQTIAFRKLRSVLMASPIRISSVFLHGAVYRPDDLVCYAIAMELMEKHSIGYDAEEGSE
jgi:hypothetical protein